MVITISREFGSGGKYIGERLAEDLGLELYDKELLKKVSYENGIDYDILQDVDEKQEESFWYSYARSFYSEMESIDPLSGEIPSSEKIFIDQTKVIEDLASKDNCIIIGRCSNVILKNRQNVLNVFVYSSDPEFKINRKLEYSDVKNREELIDLMNTTDLERTRYYNHFTGKTWGNRNDYDLLVDVSKLGIDNTIELIKKYIDLKK